MVRVRVPVGVWKQVLAVIRAGIRDGVRAVVLAGVWAGIRVMERNWLRVQEQDGILIQGRRLYMEKESETEKAELREKIFELVDHDKEIIRILNYHSFSIADLEFLRNNFRKSKRD